ncbi:MAG: kinase/pyrophosphorylase [Deltaproteobacteria bacterium]|nr:MAG: kinase/pyrophosphorylase [Deltaproteobacteria bacterium]
MDPKALSRPTIYVISDATGNTAENVVRAALLQFGHQSAQLRVFPQVRSRERIDDLLAQVPDDALLVFTLVNHDLREHLQVEAERRQLPHVDLLSPLLYRLTEVLGTSPDGIPGLLHRMDESYFRRIEAVEFAVRNDDGKNPVGLHRADILLVGVSRTSKTPVSAVLAGKGFKVANIPLVHGVDPPPELFALPPGRVFALTIDPGTLLSIRRSRLAQLGMDGQGAYTDRHAVLEEVQWALRLFRTRTRWPVIDVTRMAVEETAAEILRQRDLLLARP